MLAVLVIEEGRRSEGSSLFIIFLHQLADAGVDRDDSIASGICLETSGHGLGFEVDILHTEHRQLLGAESAVDSNQDHIHKRKVGMLPEQIDLIRRKRHALDGGRSGFYTITESRIIFLADLMFECIFIHEIVEAFHPLLSGCAHVCVIDGLLQVGGPDVLKAHGMERSAVIICHDPRAAGTGYDLCKMLLRPFLIDLSKSDRVRMDVIRIFVIFCQSLQGSGLRREVAYGIIELLGLAGGLIKLPSGRLSDDIRIAALTAQLVNTSVSVRQFHQITSKKAQKINHPKATTPASHERRAYAKETYPFLESDGLCNLLPGRKCHLL